MNYLWNKVNGKIEVANFTLCYIDYMTELKEQNLMLNMIVVWTDGCSYQNRCNILATSLLPFEQNITVYIKYLEVGQTHMECDSIHSAVEKQKQKTDVNLPTDYVEIIKKHG